MSFICSSIESKIISFCGVDGTGKSTLMNMLKAEEAIKNAIYFHKESKQLVELVKNYHSRKSSSYKDWLNGSFAEAAAIATAFDFLLYYNKDIKPSIGSQRYLICDRYTPCYIAYIKSVGSSFSAIDLFEAIKPPDLVIYIETPIELLGARYKSRGGASEEEHCEIMYAFDKAYNEVLSSNNFKTIKVKNDANIISCYSSLKKQLFTFLDESL